MQYYFRLHIISIASKDQTDAYCNSFSAKACIYSVVFVLDNFIYTIHMYRKLRTKSIKPIENMKHLYF